MTAARTWLSLTTATALVTIWLTPSAQSPPQPDTVPVHPLDPLTANEIRQVTRALAEHGRLTDRRRIVSLELDEPPKAARVQDVVRTAIATIHDRGTGAMFEATVDVSGHRVVNWTARPSGHPPLYMDDFVEANRLVRADARWRDGLRRRGIESDDEVQIETAPAGEMDREHDGYQRLVRAIAFLRGSSTNPYARPIDGLVATVDLGKGAVLAVLDGPQVSPLPPVRELPSAQPTSPPDSFAARARPYRRTGFEIHWGAWRFRYGFHPRAGVALSHVAFNNAGHWRSVIHSASVSEVLTIYADPQPAWSFRSVFDEGEYGLGLSMVSLVPGGDVPHDAELMDAVFAGSGGAPQLLPRTIAAYERDAGVHWRHTDYVTGQAIARRGRELVVAWAVTAANYDYGFRWVFHSDGSFGLEIDLSGIVQVRVSPSTVLQSPTGHHSPFSHDVARGLRAVHHQHFFNVRVDMDVAGTDNTLLELEAAPMPSGATESAAFVMNERMVRREGPLHAHAGRGRRWRIANETVRNELGQPVGYTLLPGESSAPQSPPGSWIRRRAGFLDASVWVTPFAREERYAAGQYVFQSSADSGLATWTTRGRSVANRDIVLWHTIGVTHLARPEEWPVMPVYRAGFRLVPSGFTIAPVAALPRPSGSNR